MFFAANEQVGHVNITLVIDQRTAVDTADVQAICRRDRNGCAAVPFILPAGVQIDIGLAADHGHRFGTC